MGRQLRLCAGARRPSPFAVFGVGASAGETASIHIAKLEGGGRPSASVQGRPPRGPRGCPSLIVDTSGSARSNARFRGPCWIVAAGIVAAIALMAVIAPPASAHKGSPNYRSTVRAITPAESGVQVQVLNYDDRLLLINRSGKTVLVRGYDGEPYIRVLGDGAVEVNKNSPAYYLNQDRYGNVTVPSTAQPGATPAWQTLDKTGRYEWHDHRIHYMAKGTPPQVKDRNKRTKIFAWQVPIDVGGRPAKLLGDLYWQPPTGGLPRGALLALAALVFGGIAFVEIVRRRRRQGARGGKAKAAWG